MLGSTLTIAYVLAGGVMVIVPVVAVVSNIKNPKKNTIIENDLTRKEHFTSQKINKKW